MESTMFSTSMGTTSCVQDVEMQLIIQDSSSITYSGFQTRSSSIVSIMYLILYKPVRTLQRITAHVQDSKHRCTFAIELRRKTGFPYRRSSGFICICPQRLVLGPCNRVIQC
jgi:hypothetical protein